MKILVDTQIWSAHLARANTRLRHLVDVGLVVVHPYVLCELALGDLGPQRGALLRAMAQAARAPQVPVEEVYGFVERERLERSGIGYVDAALLASAREGGLRIWTEDRALGAAAAKLRLRFIT